MKNIIIKLLLLSSIAVIAFLVLQPKVQKKHTQQEMENISKAFSEEFAQVDKKRAEKTSRETVAKKSTGEKSIQQSIIGVIYKQPQTTWFIKVKDTKEKIDTISASFKNYFIDQMVFNKNHQPDFSHIPTSMRTENKSSMRYATFLIGDVEVSVSQLAGQQDVFANVKRWMRQIGLNDDSKIQIDFRDDKKTIIVKMPR